MPTRNPITPAEAFEGLPDEVRQAIESSGWQEKLRRIASRASLRIDQGGALEDETLRFMAGLQSVEEYAVHLAQEIPMPEADFKSFVDELEREIFVPVQAKLKEILPNEEDGASPAAASVGEHEEDDLEALLNEGEDALAKVAAMAPAPKPLSSVMPVPAASTPAAATPATAAPTPFAPVAPNPEPRSDLSAVTQKLSAPVTKPAETVVGNLQRAPLSAPTPNPLTPTKISPDPYREPFN